MLNNMRRNEKGFTLVEIAIVTVIASIVLLSVFRALALYTEQVAIAESNENIDISQVAMSRFFEDNGRYPCPAPLDAVPGDADFGLEQCNPDDLDTGTIDNPIDADEDTVGTPDDLILVGAVPVLTLEPCLRNDLLQCNFRDFFITEEAMYDGWGNHLTYAVTQELADPAGNFSNNGGVIDVQDENKESILERPFSAHFVIISHGKNGRGSFNKDGNRVQDNCVASIDEGTGVETPFASSSTQYSDRENCDHINGIYVSALVNEGDPDRTYFDDTVYFRLVELSSLWERTGQSEMINKNEGFVGIGDFDDANPPTAQLHIQGDMQAIDLYADRLCDSTGSFCFRPEFLGGDAKTTNKADADDYKNTCDNPAQAIFMISENEVYCRDVFTGGIIQGECAKDDPSTTGVNEYEVMVGYSNQTGIICDRLYPP